MSEITRDQPFGDLTLNEMCQWHMKHNFTEQRSIRNLVEIVKERLLDLEGLENILLQIGENLSQTSLTDRTIFQTYLLWAKERT